MRDAETDRVGDLEIHQDLPFQRRSWTVQRVGWAIMALVVLAGLLGGLWLRGRDERRQRQPLSTEPGAAAVAALPSA